MNSETRAYSYIRMSTDRQLRGDSLRRQLELSRAFAQRHNLVLDDSLRDIGVSAWKGKNSREGALSEFLKLARAGRIPRGSYLLIESLDRLSRDQVVEALSLFLEILKMGIVIATLADDCIYSQESVGNDWTRLIMSLTIMARAHEESQRKSHRVREAVAARRQKAAQGIGRFTHHVPGWIEQTKHENGQIDYTLNEHAGAVRLIYEMAADGIGQMTITKHLNDNNVPTMRGRGQWHQSAVAKVLDTDAVIGVYHPSRNVDGQKVPLGDPIPDYYPAVIIPSLYAKAQKARKRRITTTRKGPTVSNLFIGFGECVHCRGPMSMSSSRANGKPYRYIRCYSCRAHRGCTTGTHVFNYEVLEKAVLDHVREFRLADVFDREDQTKAVDDLQQQIADTKLKLETASKGVQNITASLEAAEPDAIVGLMDVLNTRAKEKKALEDAVERLGEALLLAEAEARERTDVDVMIAEERAKWADMSEPDLLRSRSRVHSALKQFVDRIEFDSRHETATVIIGNGMAAYQFRNGKLANEFKATRKHVNWLPGSLAIEDFKKPLPGSSPEDTRIGDEVIEIIRPKRLRK